MARERREHRVALEVLYAADVGKVARDDAIRQAREGSGVFARGDAALEDDPYEPVYPAMDRRADAPRPTDWELVDRLVTGALEHTRELEAQIGPLLRRWKLERLSGIDRLILIMAAWELRYRPDADAASIINHAVELARRFSTERSGQFVNGVLDALAKTPPVAQ